ncbi:cell envelope-related function transcriptional attenuator common domain-containing protein [Arthrobacter alpinus]|uniref:Cell envelope-related function transcriptional attenuator common domain-containing protein n=1 Tax=Arthrobacter alpinus TaxID=656366 RepID=A0A0U3H0D3_9MICC|nr:LCP family protein [Arthrobacter alpinus]ALV44902.1 hypothetical protein MB46_04650 [Arthrobacter alpinus]SEE51394.1 cell envelope-related function transcriptional attenuator common domain-containing protein [Arthrobacter alpinus]
MGRRRAETGAAEAVSTPRRKAHRENEPVGRHFRPRAKAPLWLRITTIAVTAVLVLGVGAAGALVFKLQNNVTTAPLNAGVKNGDSGQPENADTGALQILILGTDTRDGANSQYGSEEDSTGEGNSDVMLLMDISADNSHVSVTSFPRDLIVPIPDCKPAAGGDPVAGTPAGQLNAALRVGPGCTVAAINDMTGLTIDHFMLADFTAVKELSNALGGVEVCVDHAMYDDDGSWLKLPAGKSLVQGEQALAFVRTRHAFGDSSDLARIKAQQYFLGSMVRKVKSEGTLTNLPKLYNLADVVTKNLTIDEGLANIPSMISIANRLAKIDLANVAFVTVPYEAYVADNARVQLKEPEAGQYFAALRQGTSLTGAPATASPSAAAASGTPSDTATVAPTTEAPVYDKAIQQVSVTNASAVVGRSIELLQALSTAGFTGAWQAGDVPSVNETQVLYGADMGDVAADVAALFKIPATAVKSDPTITGVSVVVGTDWASGTAFGAVVVPPDIVASTADDSAGCLTVNPLKYYPTPFVQ